jgi:hypothetical protein
LFRPLLPLLEQYGVLRRALLLLSDQLLLTRFGEAGLAVDLPLSVPCLLIVDPLGLVRLLLMVTLLPPRLLRLLGVDRLLMLPLSVLLRRLLGVNGFLCCRCLSRWAACWESTAC